MKKILLIVFMSVLVSVNLSAGKEGGNGGYIQECPSKPAKEQFELYDFFEARTSEKIPWTLRSFPENASYDDIVKDILNTIERLNPNRAKLYKHWYSEFFNEIEWSQLPIVHSSDIGYGIKDPSCNDPEPVVIQRTPNHRLERFLIYEPLWNQILNHDSHITIAGLIVHELIYREMREVSDKSINTRYLNAYFFSNEILNHNLQEYIKNLQLEGMLWADANGVLIPLKTSYILFQDGVARIDQTDYVVPEEISPIEFYDENTVSKADSILPRENQQVLYSFPIERYSGMSKILPGQLYVHSNHSRFSFYRSGALREGKVEFRERSTLGSDESYCNYSPSPTPSVFGGIRFSEKYQLVKVSSGSHSVECFSKDLGLEFRLSFDILGDVIYYPNGSLAKMKSQYSKSEIILKGFFEYEMELKSVEIYQRKDQGYRGLKSFASDKRIELVDYKRPDSKNYKCKSASFSKNGKLESCEGMDRPVTYKDKFGNSYSCSGFRHQENGVKCYGTIDTYDFGPLPDYSGFFTREKPRKAPYLEFILTTGEDTIKAKASFRDNEQFRISGTFFWKTLFKNKVEVVGKGLLKFTSKFNLSKGLKFYTGRSYKKKKLLKGQEFCVGAKQRWVACP